MTGSDFSAWMTHMGWNILETAEHLGLGRNTVARYMREGAPNYIGYACAAIAYGLPKWASVQGRDGPAPRDHAA